VALSLQQIARALNGQIRNDQVLAPGPGHGTGDQSLSVKINDAGDDVIVYTFSPADDVMACKRYVRERCGIQFKPNGRSPEDIARLLHDAVASERREPRTKPVAVYEYTEADGKLLYQVCRYEPKRFQHRQPDGHGGWIYKGTHKRVVYRWRELLEFPSATVFVCEGEKDTDNVRCLGLCATTVASGKWTDDCIQALAGRDCCILEDNDDAGRNKALEAAKLLHPVANSIKIIRLPDLGEGGDVSDWLGAGHTKGELEDICYWAPDWEPEASSSMAVTTTTTASATTADVWPTMDCAAYYGVAGEIANTIDPHTEADRVAILIQLLAGFGNVVGSNPYYQVESDRHHANLFGVLVGKTSKARKGTAAGRVRAILRHADELWVTKGGLSSGEGLIEQVRDEIKKWDPKAKTFEVVAPAVADKRLMVAEAEFGSVLQVRGRDGNTLSSILRNAWDGLTLQTLTRNQPLKATNPHISIIGHITEEELRLELTRTDMASGFANRFIYALVKRSKELPDGGNLSDDEITRLGTLIKDAADAAKNYGRVRMTDEARDLWHGIYKDLSAGQPGLLGAITGRAEAQVIRLALIYALLDSSNQISLSHLKAAVAVWEYCEASAARIFGK
jgi:hypothetical protein